MRRAVLIALMYMISDTNVHCMSSGLVEFCVQNLSNRKLSFSTLNRAVLSFDTDAGERDRINFSEKQSVYNICVVLKKNKFATQTINVKTLSPSREFFTINVRKDYADNPPIVTTSSSIGLEADLRYRIYRSLLGGGSAFVIAIGSADEEVSVASVKKYQEYGNMQTYLPL
jgi:hypothetical protein